MMGYLPWLEATFKKIKGFLPWYQLGTCSPKAKMRPTEKEMIVLDGPSYIMIDPCGAI
jgi:hypothetical protein